MSAAPDSLAPRAAAPVASAGGSERVILRRPGEPGRLARLMEGAGCGLRRLGYRSSAYRLRLAGRHPLRLLGSPEDPWPGDGAAGRSLIAGTMRAGGAEIATGGTEFWRRVARHPEAGPHATGFLWLRDLAAADDLGAARACAESLLRAWLESCEELEPPDWAPLAIGRRLAAWILHAPLILASQDLVYRSAVLNSMARQARHLARTAADAGRDDEVVEAAAGLVVAGLLLPEGEAWRRRGEVLLGTALERFVLPDGGPASRQLPHLLTVVRTAIVLLACYEDRSTEAPLLLRHMLDRAIPFLRALRHGDGGFAHLAGAQELAVPAIEHLLTRSGAAGKPVENARHSGLMRARAGRALVLFDCMPPPALRDSAAAHAGTLAFELSDGPARVVVNIGKGTGQLETLTRTTAAHSTLVLADTNSTELRPDGRLGAGVTAVQIDREELPEGLRIEAMHDGYRGRHGALHARSLMLSSDGRRLLGFDRVLRLSGGRKTDYAIRFHLHPDVAVSKTQGGEAVLLRLADHHGWLFRAEEGEAAIEDSVWIEDGRPRRSSQIVLSGNAGPGETVRHWRFERLDGKSPPASSS